MGQCFEVECNHQSSRDSCRHFRFPIDLKTCHDGWKCIISRRCDRAPKDYDRLCSCHFVDGNKENGPTKYGHKNNKRRFSNARKKKSGSCDVNMLPTDFIAGTIFKGLMVDDNGPNLRNAVIYPDHLEQSIVKEEFKEEKDATLFFMKNEPSCTSEYMEPPKSPGSEMVESYLDVKFPLECKEWVQPTDESKLNDVNPLPEYNEWLQPTNETKLNVDTERIHSSSESLSQKKNGRTKQTSKSRNCSAFNCKLCPPETDLEYLFTNHSLNHNRKKSLSCSNCPYTTNKIDAMINHMIGHSTEKPYVCQLCFYKTDQTESLQVHLLDHCDATSLQCKVCPYAAKRTRNLYKHMIIHTGRKMFSCPICSFKNNRKSGLKAHIRALHW